MILLRVFVNNRFGGREGVEFLGKGGRMTFVSATFPLMARGMSDYGLHVLVDIWGMLGWGFDRRRTTCASFF